ncbi:1-acyl-sn-glycerol-3-phosphate acyltransferase [Orobanche hederae]
MWFSGFIFLERNWAKDEDTMKSGFEELSDFPMPSWLSLFVEGTRFTREKLVPAQEYVALAGSPVPRNILIPRTKEPKGSLSQRYSGSTYGKLNSTGMERISVSEEFLRNNSFYGAVQGDILYLKKLEVLDLGYNNLSGQLPCSLQNNFSMTIILTDNNELLSSTYSEIYVLQKSSSEVQVEEILSGTDRASSCYSIWK